MTVREKRALKNNLSRWFDQTMKGLFELMIIVGLSTSFMIYLWCCI
ncbi:hypothetical protein [Niameybacter massiliensis]|nr:hypothetical protein [Niameybacter massiliensis]